MNEAVVGGSAMICAYITRTTISWLRRIGKNEIQPMFSMIDLLQTAKSAEIFVLMSVFEIFI